MNKVGVFVLTGIGMLVMLVVGDRLAQAETNLPAAMDPAFIKTNGDAVTIGFIEIKTNSPLNTDKFKQYRWRVNQVTKIVNSGASNATDLVVEGAWGLIKDDPDGANGYQFIMMAIEDYAWDGEPAKSRALAGQLMASTAPESYKRWTKGFLNRLDLLGNPVSLQFTAVDGREVDLARMKGKVVLVDFWETGCRPCVAELPRVKAALEKFQSQGFEVIGISCDTDKKELEKFLQRQGLSWPQYFDGQGIFGGKFNVEYGIDGVPHMFLVDREGRLRFDNVRANDKYNAKGDTMSFEDKITQLLAEK